jgi:excisionase family DNA binding protein
VGEDQDTTQDKVTIQEAARRLGVKEDAVRKRIQRGSMRHEKAEDGRVYVWVDAAQDTTRDAGQTTQDAYQDTAQDERVEDLREQVGYLRSQLDEEREARRRADTIIAQLARTTEEQARTIRELEAPAETPAAEPVSSETTAAPSEDTPPRSSTGGSDMAAEGLSEAEPSLLWERVAVVILSIAANIVEVGLGQSEGIPWPWAGFVFAGSAVLAWIVIPAVFGFRLGRKSRSLRFWRNVAPVAALLGLVSVFPALLFGLGFAFFYFIPSLVYIFAAVLGNALQRRHREALVEARSSEFPQEAAAPAQGWTPRQQAVVGLVGTIISSLIGLIGTILTVVMASGNGG